MVDDKKEKMDKALEKIHQLCVEIDKIMMENEMQNVFTTTDNYKFTVKKG